MQRPQQNSRIYLYTLSYTFTQNIYKALNFAGRANKIKAYVTSSDGHNLSLAYLSELKNRQELAHISLLELETQWSAPDKENPRKLAFSKRILPSVLTETIKGRPAPFLYSTVCLSLLWDPKAQPLLGENPITGSAYITFTWLSMFMRLQNMVIQKRGQTTFIGNNCTKCYGVFHKK